MTTNNDSLTEFERRARDVLEESITHIDAHTRSRLNQARQAALAEVERQRSVPWLRYGLVSAAGTAAAAILILFTVMNRGPGLILPTDLELLADDDAFTLMEGLAEGDGAFYEWAVAQAELQDVSG